MKGVIFGEKHSYNDWKLMLTSKNISFPSIKKETIDIPGADGKLDFTESLSNDIKYDNRKLEFEFFVDTYYRKWYSLISEISNYLHGKSKKIILDDDPGFYYIGRAEINQFKTEKTIGKISINCDVEPYKYDINSSLDDWLWDPFNFENGVINYTKDIKVEGKRKVTIYGRRKKIIPKITCDNELQVIFNSNTYNLLSGTQRILNIEICEGINTLEFVGNGTVSIEYRGGSL